MRSLVRTRSSRRGERSKAITASESSTAHGSASAVPQAGCCFAAAAPAPESFARDLVERVARRSRVDRPRAQVARRTGCAPTPCPPPPPGRRSPACRGPSEAGPLGSYSQSSPARSSSSTRSPAAASRSRTRPAYSRCRSEIGSTTAWTGRQPQRPGAGIVLDQQRDEPLEAAENRPVDDHRPVLGVVGADVLQVEPLRHLVVELNRRALPLPADRVGDVEVDLRAVERAVALVDRVRLRRPPRAPASAPPRRDPTSRSRRGTPRAASTASPRSFRPKSP